MRREMSDELKSFLDAGIYRLDVDGSKVAFLDPVRVLNRSYSRFKIYPSAYYSRSFGCSTAGDESKEDKVFQVTKKRKKRRPARDLNEKEKAAEKRHQVFIFLIFSGRLIYFSFFRNIKVFFFLIIRKQDLCC